MPGSRSTGPAEAAAARTRRGTAVRWVAGAGAVVLVAGLAVVAQGYDAQELPRVETSVWVSRDSGRYARVNTTLGEIDTVRSVSDPSTIVQSGGAGAVFGQGFGSLWPIDAAVPADLVLADEDRDPDAADAAPATTPGSTPAGTRTVVTAGDRLLLLTDLGDVYLGSVAAAAAGDAGFARIDPFADAAPEDEQAEGPPPSYSATAATVSASGIVALYSPAEGAVRRYDADRGVLLGAPAPIDLPPGTAAPASLTMVGSRWVMLQPSAGLLWVEGRAEPFEADVAATALLQSPGPDRGAVAIADTDGLLEVALDDGAATRVPASGTPTRPRPVGDMLVSAWIGVDSGALWLSTGEGLIPLETEPEVLADLESISPAVRSNGDRAVINETVSGMLWTVPEGTLIPVSAWNSDEDEDSDEGSIMVDDASEQQPPEARPDAFGVRAGALVSLPLLYNDSDPNRDDIVTIVPEGGGSAPGTPADPSFGTLSLVGGHQTATVLVTASTGSTTFDYRVTDGAAVSPPATVTLTVIPDEVNTPPEWCGVEGCTQRWPSPEVAPGGSIVVPVLGGWVDPEGDPFVLADARVVSGQSVVAVPTADGRVAIRHLDPNGPAGQAVVLVTVVDAHGASAERELVVGVSATPALEVRGSAVVAAAGETTRLLLSDVVVGGSGAYRLTDAADSAPDGEAVTVIPNAADGAIELSARAPGDYTIAFTVLDTVTSAERTGTARFTVLPAGSRIAVPPLTAFVRPGEDATIGVLDAVQNTTGRVLIVASATADRPELAAAVVDQSTVRVRGTTPDGLPGRVGTVAVVVTDGAGTTAEGRITVFLAPVERDVAPIALPDSVTVRAGAQLDIPVLANDVAARGEQLSVHPEVVGSGAPGELAFAAGDVVRYLAPTAPGQYTLGYSAFPASSPELLASSTITVTVLAEGANRAPQPRTLTARAVTGTTVRIPLPASGLDPDGDAVVLVSVDQPAAGLGSAAVAPAGDAILYRAPDSAVAGGQVAFGYLVRDSAGATAAGQVRVGVIDDDLADLTPITYANHVRTTVSSTAPVRVLPLADDRDPAQGSLELVSLEPLVAGGPGSPEYDRLAGLVGDGTSLASGVVELLPGDVVGTHSYVYTVRSTATTSTAEGLIVVTVGRDPAPDAPRVADTVIGLADRGRLASGVDVVAGRVQWALGDPADLALSVWGPAAATWTASGSRISGPVPAAGALVPFELRGADASGAEAVSYGFLRIPALDDMRVQPAPGLRPLEVDEEATLRFAAADVVAVGAGDALEVRAEASLTVQRPGASCRVEGDEVVYAAGREAPWADTCGVPVRVAGQQTWTVVAVPIVVIPKDPRAILQSVGRTISPGATDTIDLYADMTSWEAGRIGDRGQLGYEIAYSGSAFVLSRDGDRLAVQATASAVPGTKETVRVTSAAFGGLSASISLTVGVAPVDAPRGAGVSGSCVVTASCVVTVTGVAGEYDPFAGTPGSGLTLVAVGDAGGTAASCGTGTIGVSSGSTLTATWPAASKPEGGSCTVAFTVADAQGRRGAGTLTLDVRGFPAPPTSLTTVDYSATSVTLEVALGAAASAQPPLTGVAIYEGGAAAAAACSPAGATAYRCEVEGLVNGQQHVYTARAVNEVGSSPDTSAHTTWSYQAPAITSLTASPVFVAGRTTVATGVVELAIAAGEDAVSFRVVETGATIPRTGAVSTGLVDLPAGATSPVQVVPVSQFAPPIGSGGEGSAASTTVLVAGSPYFAAGGSVATSADGTSATVGIPPVEANGSTQPTATLWVASQSDSVTCGTTGSGAPTATGGTGLRTSSTPTITGLAPNTDYWFSACGANGYGAAASASVGEFTWVDPSSPTGGAYTVASAAAGGGGSWWWTDVSVSVPAPPAGAYTLFTIDGATTTSLGPGDFTTGSVPTISAQFCRSTAFGERCGAAASVGPSAAPATMAVDFPTGCPADGSAPDPVVSGGAAGRADVAVASTPDPGAGEVTHQYALTWIGAYASLAPPDAYSLTCPLP